MPNPEIDLEDEDAHFEKGTPANTEEIENLAFDEMNLIEIPFCLLHKNNQACTSKLSTIALSEEGHEYLQVSGQRYGLPTALAEPVVLGLMWLTMQQNGFQSRKVQFSLRSLVEHFMYPDRYHSYRASGKLLESVEDEMHRVAATRIHSDRWYDRKLDRKVDIDASIIDAMTVVDRGGKNAPRILEVVWGTKVYESIRARYTKALDIRTYLKIKTPLARRLYRWLDRQLSSKQVQTVKSCQNFARYKMLMTGEVIDRGGRTTSTYIVKCFREVLENFCDIGFAVRMTVDESKQDFSLLFERVMGKKENEIIEEDEAGALVRYFLEAFHGLEANGKKRRFKSVDRQTAQRWIDSYGERQANWMIGRCAELHRESKRGRERIFSFKGLEFYETVAACDYENLKKKAPETARKDEKDSIAEFWPAYEDQMLNEADKLLTSIEQLDIAKQAEARIREQYQGAFKHGLSCQALIKNEVKNAKLAQIGALSQEQFMAYKSEAALKKALVEKHGYNPLMSLGISKQLRAAVSGSGE